MPPNVWALSNRQNVAAGTEAPVTHEYYQRPLDLRSRRISDPISGRMLRFGAV